MARGGDRDKQHKTKKTDKGSKGQNRSAGEAYLEKQSQKLQNQRSISSLLYEIVDPGDAHHPDLKATLTIHYRIGLVNGKIFSDTYQRDEPHSYRLADVIDGLAEGIQLIGVGGKIRLIIPPDLAWGAKGIGNDIDPHAVIIWTAELIDWY